MLARLEVAWASSPRSPDLLNLADLVNLDSIPLKNKTNYYEKYYLPQPKFSPLFTRM